MASHQDDAGERRGHLGELVWGRRRMRSGGGVVELIARSAEMVEQLL
jgi:hypothetical protein